MTQLSGAHAFRRSLPQLSTDSHEILYRTFPSHVGKNFVKLYAELHQLDHLTSS